MIRLRKGAHGVVLGAGRDATGATDSSIPRLCVVSAAPDILRRKRITC
jgi:hypothetical protein